MQPVPEPMSVDTHFLLSHLVPRHYLSTNDIKPIAKLIKKVVRNPQGNQERRIAEQLLLYCAQHYPADLAYKLSAIFISREPENAIRVWSISFLHQLLEQRARFLGSHDMDSIGKSLVSWLSHNEDFPERGFKILSKVVSRFASHAFSRYPAGNWDELGRYMSGLIQSKFRNGVQIFRDLPFPLSAHFLIPVLDDIYEKIVGAIDLQIGDENWVSAFGAGFVLALQQIHCGCTISVADIMSYSVKSVILLANHGKEGLLRRGLLDVEEFSRANAEKFNKNAYDYASELMRRINGLVCVGQESKEITRRIAEVLEEKCRKKVRVHFFFYHLR